MFPRKIYYRYRTFLFLALSSAGAEQLGCGQNADCRNKTAAAPDPPDLPGAPLSYPCGAPHCICDKGYYLEPDEKTCKQTTAIHSKKRRQTTRGNQGSSVGSACLTSGDCLEGLRCSKGDCLCPEDCLYDSNLIACYCGADEFSSLPLIMVAVLWAPINIFIWYKCFKTARKGRGNKRRTEDLGHLPPKMALHPASPSPPQTEDDTELVPITYAEPTTFTALATHTGTSASSTSNGVHVYKDRPVFVVPTDETEHPADSRHSGTATPQGLSFVTVPGGVWQESPRVQ